MDINDKISINGKNYFAHTVLKYLEYLITVLGCFNGCKRTGFNLRNIPLCSRFGIAYYGPRGLRQFIIDNKLCEILEKKKRTKDNRECDTFILNPYNLCNFMLEFYKKTKLFIAEDLMEDFLDETNLPNKVYDCLYDLKDGFVRPLDHSPDSAREYAIAYFTPEARIENNLNTPRGIEFYFFFNHFIRYVVVPTIIR